MSEKLIEENRRALFDSASLDRYAAGTVATGTR
jgi:tmRNA-binding protein